MPVPLFTEIEIMKAVLLICVQISNSSKLVLVLFKSAFILSVNRRNDRRECLSTQQSKSVDFQRGRTMPQPTNETRKAIQIHRCVP